MVVAARDGARNAGEAGAVPPRTGPPTFMEETCVCRWQLAAMLPILVVALFCGPRGAKSQKCFDDIRAMVKGKTADEVERLLGQPDSRQQMFFSAERWFWWNYTYLDGDNYPPEMRGQVVHLEIIFERTGSAKRGPKPSLSDLRAVDPLAVNYTSPQAKM